MFSVVCMEIADLSIFYSFGSTLSELGDILKDIIKYLLLREATSTPVLSSIAPPPGTYYPLKLS